jgi:hypothetical protein
VKIKDLPEFITYVKNYFPKGFPNKFVQDLFAEKLSYIKPSDFGRLFDQLITSLPADWSPDIKALNDAIGKCRIALLDEPGSQKECPVCYRLFHGTGLCPDCCYDPEKDGTPNEHRAWWTDWKAGKIERFDTTGILSGLADKKNVRERA